MQRKWRCVTSKAGVKRHGSFYLAVSRIILLREADRHVIRTLEQPCERPTSGAMESSHQRLFLVFRTVPVCTVKVSQLKPLRLVLCKWRQVDTLMDGINLQPLEGAPLEASLPAQPSDDHSPGQHFTAAFWETEPNSTAESLLNPHLQKVCNIIMVDCFKPLPLGIISYTIVVK